MAIVTSNKTLEVLKVSQLKPFDGVAVPVEEWKVGKDAVVRKKDVTTQEAKGKQHKPSAGNNEKGKRQIPLDDSDATFVPKDCKFMLICLVRFQLLLQHPF